MGEIEKDPNGWEGVLQRFLFNGSVEAEKMLEKLVAGTFSQARPFGYHRLKRVRREADDIGKL